MRKAVIWLCLAVIWAVPLSGSANEALYQAQVEIADRTSSTRARVLDQALAQVLVKVTGEPQYLLDPVIRQALASSSRYLEAYRYSSDNDNITFLHATFSSAAINSLLKQANLPLWPANRPKVLAWLVWRDYQTGVHTVLPGFSLSDQGLSADDSQPVLLQLSQLAKQRGLPLALPLMDLEDQIKLSADQLWGLDTDAISQASRRYPVDALLVGRITATSQGMWRIGWWYLQGTQYEVFNSEHESLNQALGEGLSALTAYLARIYAVPVSDRAGQVVTAFVDGIGGFDQYAGLINYLDGLAAISDYNIEAISGSQVEVSLYLNGDQKLLLDALALDKKLQPASRYGSALSAASMPLVWIDR